MLLVASKPVVSEARAGSRVELLVAIPVDELEARLGPTAIAVWVCLLGRSRAGITTATVAQMTSLTNVGRAAVERVFARLVRLGLLGRASRRVHAYVSSWSDARWTIQRQVFGVWRPKGAPFALIPPETEQRLRTGGWGGARPNTGGARPGAGRKRGKKKALSSSEAEQLLTTPASSEPTVTVSTDRGLAVEVIDAANPWSEIPDGFVHSLFDPRVEDLVASPAAVPAVVTPNPPLLPLGADAQRWLELAYCGSVRSRTKAVPKVFHRQAARYKSLLVAASELLSERGVPPASWAAYQTDRWAERGASGNGSFEPPVKWFFAPDVIRQFWAQCLENYALIGGRRQMTPAGHAYLAKYQRQKVVFSSLAATDRSLDRVRYALAGVYPPAERALELARASAEVKLAQQVLDARVQSGEWVWL